MFLDADDDPGPDLVRQLASAQGASGADVVTCGVRSRTGEGAIEWIFDGDPVGLGVLENRFGTLGLLRRELATRALPSGNDGGADPDWSLYADLALRGARISSIPEPLVERSLAPGDSRSAPVSAARVVALYEQALPAVLGGLGRLAGAASVTGRDAPVMIGSLTQRMRAVAAREGIGGVVRRIRGRLRMRNGR
jgi:hypothetical protein